MTLTEELASWAARLDFDDIPERIVAPAANTVARARTRRVPRQVRVRGSSTSATTPAARPASIHISEALV